MMRFKNFRAAALSRFAVTTVSYLLFVIDGTPEIVELAVDFHKHLAQNAEYQRHWVYPRMCATRFFLISSANMGPNRFHQNRTVSWLVDPAFGQEILCTMTAEDLAQANRTSLRRWSSRVVPRLSRLPPDRLSVPGLSPGLLM